RSEQTARRRPSWRCAGSTRRSSWTTTGTAASCRSCSASCSNRDRSRPGWNRGTKVVAAEASASDGSSQETAIVKHEPRRRTLGVLLFPGFELLDVFGPLEAFGMRVAKPHFEAALLAEHSGPVESAQGPRALAEATIDARPVDLVLV